MRQPQLHVECVCEPLVQLNAFNMNLVSFVLYIALHCTNTYFVNIFISFLALLYGPTSDIKLIEDLFIIWVK